MYIHCIAAFLTLTLLVITILEVSYDLIATTGNPAGYLADTNAHGNFPLVFTSEDKSIVIEYPPTDESVTIASIGKDPYIIAIIPLIVKYPCLLSVSPLAVISVIPYPANVVGLLVIDENVWLWDDEAASLIPYPPNVVGLLVNDANVWVWLEAAFLPKSL